MVTMTSIVSGVMKCVLSYSTMCMILVTCTWASLRARLVEWRGVTGTYLAVGAGAVGGVIVGRHVELQIKRLYL